MTVDTAPTSSAPTVFDAGLPSVVYLHLHDPLEAHRIIAAARQQAPIAMGGLLHLTSLRVYIGNCQTAQHQ